MTRSRNLPRQGEICSTDKREVLACISFLTFHIRRRGFEGGKESIEKRNKKVHTHSLDTHTHTLTRHTHVLSLSLSVTHTHTQTHVRIFFDTAGIKR